MTMQEKFSYNKNSNTVKKRGAADDIDKHVGAQLHKKRSDLGLKQNDLAEAVNITFQQIQKYEQGKNRISAGRLFNFSKFLGVPLSYFYEGLDGHTSITSVSDNAQTSFQHDIETKNLIDTYYSITDKEAREHILGLMRSMADKK